MPGGQRGEHSKLWQAPTAAAEVAGVLAGGDLAGDRAVVLRHVGDRVPVVGQALGVNLLPIRGETRGRTGALNHAEPIRINCEGVTERDRLSTGAREVHTSARAKGGGKGRSEPTSGIGSVVRRSGLLARGSSGDFSRTIRKNGGCT